MDPTEEQLQKILLELHKSIITFEFFKSQVFMFQMFLHHHHPAKDEF